MRKKDLRSNPQRGFAASLQQSAFSDQLSAFSFWNYH
jgi:hypothetical protein